MACALVPMLGGIAMVALLQRAPTLPRSAADRGVPEVHGGTRGEAAHRPWVGVVVAGTTAELAAETDGVVVELLVQNGTRVSLGDKLLRFDEAESSSAVGIASAELGQRRSELSRAREKSAAAQGRLQRLRASAEWISKQELDNATAEARLARAELHAARAGVSMGRQRVSRQRRRRERQVLTAPFAGTVATLGVGVGDSVMAGQIVLRVLSDERQVRFAFPAGELVDREVAIRLRGTEIETLGEVTEMRPEIDPSAQLLFATAALPARLPAAARWIPGAPVHVVRPLSPRVPEVD